MRSRSLELLLLFALLALSGGVAWSIRLDGGLAAAPASLSTLPHRLAGFEGVDLPLEGSVEEMLDADYNVQREYVHPFGQSVWLYVGYYSTRRGGTPEHTPRTCYAAHGWEVVQETTLTSDPLTGHPVQELLVQSQGERQLVVFWYRSFRRTGMLSKFALHLDHLLGRLSDGRADGALVRLSTPLVDTDEVAARSLLLSFARTVDAELDERWPREQRSLPAALAPAHRLLRGEPWS